MADDETTTTETREQLEALSLKALRKMATDREIEGRSGMDKAELLDALSGEAPASVDGRHESTHRATRTSTKALEADAELAELQAKIAAGDADKDDVKRHDELAQARRRRPAAVVTDAARERAEARGKADATPLERTTRGSDRETVVVTEAAQARGKATREAEAEADAEAREHARAGARVTGIRRGRRR